MNAPIGRLIGMSFGDSSPGDGGLFEFSSQIGERVAAAAPQWQADLNLRFVFHLIEPLIGHFGDGVDYLPVLRAQRRQPVKPGPVGSGSLVLWHSLNQLNRYLPPAGCGTRLTTFHDLNYLYGRNWFSTWRHHRRTQALLRRTDHIVAISHHTAGDVKLRLGWTGPLQVIHNGARSFVAAPREPLPGWADADERPFLYHLSRMSASKNPQAVIALARAWPEMLFVLCGPPSDDAKRLRATVKLPNVQFHLGISEAQKAWAYARCTGFLFPSLTEGFGLPPIEAMHFGKPVFLARRTCLPEIGGDAADYFDEFEPASMRRVVEAGLARQREPGRADAIRAHAAKFDWDRAAGAYLDLYRCLLGLPPG